MTDTTQVDPLQKKANDLLVVVTQQYQDDPLGVLLLAARTIVRDARKLSRGDNQLRKLDRALGDAWNLSAEMRR